MEFREGPVATVVLAISLLATSLLIGGVWLFLQVSAARPSPWPYLTLGFFWLIGSISLLKATPRFPRILFVSLFLAFLVVLGLPLTSRDHFVADLFRVKPGMTRADTMQIMGRYLRGSGWQGPPGKRINIVGGGSYDTFSNESGQLAITGCQIFRHSDHPNHDSDWGIVCFREERVVSVEFAPD
jgi:hypothetical protein